MAIVIGYDGSPGAQRALRVAIEMANVYSEPLVLVYAAAAPGGMGEEYRAHREALHQTGRVALDYAVAAADTAGVSTLVDLVDEKPAQALLDAAVRHEARLIVVGTYGESPMRGALLGSTPHKLLHLSPVPVLCVPGRHEGGEEE
ncbi:universal stress protein [Streptomyces sp. NPDC003635]